MKYFTHLKKSIVSAIIGMTALVTMPAHALFGVGDVVFDPAAVYQAIQQYYQLQAQYNTMKAQLESVSGSYNAGAGTKNVKDIIPGSWQDVAANQQGAFGSKQQTYDKLMQVINKEGFDKMMQDKQFGSNYNAVRMGMAVSETSYNALNEHVQNLSVLSQKINTTKTVNEAQVLANSIAIEQAYISAINARLGAVQSNLASVQTNGGISGSQRLSAWGGK